VKRHFYDFRDDSELFAELNHFLASPEIQNAPGIAAQKWRIAMDKLLDQKVKVYLWWSSPFLQGSGRRGFDCYGLPYSCYVTALSPRYFSERFGQPINYRTV
jgi:cell wall-associated NlpC family hydrolase